MYTSNTTLANHYFETNQTGSGTVGEVLDALAIHSVVIGLLECLKWLDRVLESRKRYCTTSWVLRKLFLSEGLQVGSQIYDKLVGYASDQTKNYFAVFFVQMFPN
jgi:hypothetical protein